ncbi:Uma2 family endonuclease [Geminocystis sp. CENA526]|uniref:Uma2 family endonuclease n=1 Tax=Geminocystis sp. CENA526 TaxID=1355871 RepID=UPI003D701FF4
MTTVLNLQSITALNRQQFYQLCVNNPELQLERNIELRSKSDRAAPLRDRLKPLQEKMKEYLDSGLQLGWLINPQDKTVEIYRQNQTVEMIKMPVTLSGENVLLDLEITLDY